MQRKFGTQEERRERARSNLVNATIELIAERGLLGFSLSDVGERGGVSRALPGHHFKSRAEMVRAATARIFDVDPEGAGVGLDSLIDACRQRLANAADRAPTSLAFAELVGGPLPPELAALRDQYRQAQLRLLRGQLEAARDKGQVRDDLDPVAVAPVLLSQVHAEIIRLCAEGGSGEIFLDLMMRSITPTQAVTRKPAKPRPPPVAKSETQRSLFDGE